MARDRVLVMDGAANARTALRELLEDEGYEVVTAFDDEDAREQATRFRPQVALVDASARDLGLAPSVVVMSRDPPRPDSDVLFIRKPIDVEELFATIAKATTRR